MKHFDRGFKEVNSIGERWEKEDIIIYIGIGSVVVVLFILYKIIMTLF